MKKLFLALCLCLIVSGGAYSQDFEPDYNHLKGDYNQVTIAAHVRIIKAETVEVMGGYARNLVRCEVVEPFKGGLKKGQTLEFYSTADRDYKLEGYKGERIAFLQKFYDEKNKKQVLNVLENSLVEATKNVVANMRKIKSSKQRR